MAKLFLGINQCFSNLFARINRIAFQSKSRRRTARDCAQMQSYLRPISFCYLDDLTQTTWWPRCELDPDVDDDDEIAYFTVRWKTRASFVYRQKHEITPTKTVKTENGPISRGSQWRCACVPQMKFLRQAFQKLEHQQDRQTDRQTRPNALPHRISEWWNDLTL